MIVNHVERYIEKHGPDYPFQKIAPFMRGDDVGIPLKRGSAAPALDHFADIYRYFGTELVQEDDHARLMLK